MRRFTTAIPFVVLIVSAMVVLNSNAFPTQSVGSRVASDPLGQDPPPNLALVPTPSPTPSPAPTAVSTPTPQPQRCPGSPSGVAGHTAAFADRGPNWAAGDLMERYTLPDGRTLWIFGDTWSGEVSETGELAEFFHFAHSSLLVETDGCFERVHGFEFGDWIPSVEAGVMLWPQEVYLHNGELYVFAIKVVPDDSKPVGLNFRQVGGVVAVYDLDALSVPRTMVFDVPDVRGNPFGWGPHLWGEHLYLYAHEEPTGTFVARLDPDDLRDPTAWQFWNGAEWAIDAAEAVSVAPFRLRVYERPGGGSETQPALGAAMVPVLDERLHVFGAESPVGPWTLVDQISLDAIRPDGPSWAFEPLAVEQLGSATIFAVNFLPKDTTRTLDDVTLYGPRFLEAGS